MKVKYRKLFKPDRNVDKCSKKKECDLYLYVAEVEAAVGHMQTGKEVGSRLETRVM